MVNIQNINFKNINNYLICENNKSWIITSILYASYNCTLLIPVLISIKDYIYNTKNIKYISAIVTIITIILVLNIFLFLIKVDVPIKKLEMPAVYAVNNIWPEIKNIYGATILISIFTTAISLGMSFLKDVSKNERSYNRTAILLCATSVIFSKIGFSNLVNLLYPVLGVLGIFQITKIILK